MEDTMTSLLFGCLEKITPMKEFVDLSKVRRAAMAEQVMDKARWKRRNGDFCPLRLYSESSVQADGNEVPVEAELSVGLAGGDNSFHAFLSLNGQFILESLAEKTEKTSGDPLEIRKAARRLHELAEKTFQVDLRAMYNDIYHFVVDKKEPRTALWMTVIVLITVLVILIGLMARAA